MPSVLKFDALQHRNTKLRISGPHKPHLRWQEALKGALSDATLSGVTFGGAWGATDCA